MNETFCRALLQARLTEEDVAAQLEVDPKTVRRWLEGRVPYLRYRWALAAMLDRDETDLWPQLRTAQTRPDEVRAVYPHLDTVPQDVLLRLFGSAQREIGILADTGTVITKDAQVMAVLAERARAGVAVRICLPDSFAPLRDQVVGEIRLHRAIVYSSIYYADDAVLVSQHAYGIPAGCASVLHLRRDDGGDMAAMYLDSFEEVWAGARPPD